MLIHFIHFLDRKSRDELIQLLSEYIYIFCNYDTIVACADATIPSIERKRSYYSFIILRVIATICRDFDRDFFYDTFDVMVDICLPRSKEKMSNNSMINMCVSTMKEDMNRRKPMFEKIKSLGESIYFYSAPNAMPGAIKKDYDLYGQRILTGIENLFRGLSAEDISYIFQMWSDDLGFIDSCPINDDGE